MTYPWKCFWKRSRIRTAIVAGLLLCGLGRGTFRCTQESQNRLSRSIQNWTGTNGVLDIYAGEKLVLRFIEIDKLSTAAATGDGSAARPYRFGYGYADRNLNFRVDDGEKKVYSSLAITQPAMFFTRTIPSSKEPDRDELFTFIPSEWRLAGNFAGEM